MGSQLLSAEQINQALNSLPIAEEVPVFYGKDNYPEEIKDRKGILVGGQIVNIPSKKYVVVQHAEALRPIIDGLTVTGNHDFKFKLWADRKKANMKVFLGSLKDSESEIRFGFKVTNSFDGTSSLNFGFEGFKRTSTIELVGFRQVCSNGMIARVPLDHAEFTRPELVVRIKNLLKRSLKIVHIGKAQERLVDAQAITEAFMLLKEPLQRIIDRAEDFDIKDRQIAEDFIVKYLGKRVLNKVLDQFTEEQQTMWGLYNAATNIATHTEMSNSRRDSMLRKASVMLE